MYETIKALISRNDFTTAERLMDKHHTVLSEEQCRELRKLLLRQRRSKQAEVQKKQKHLRRTGHWRITWALKRFLVAGWTILGIILYPYAKIHYLAVRQGLSFQPRLSMELMFLLGLFLAVLFCGLGLFEARQAEKVDREAIDRAAQADRPDAETFRLLQRLEAYHRKEGKGWRTALLGTAAAALFQLWSICRTFFL